MADPSVSKVIERPPSGAPTPEERGLKTKVSQPAAKDETTSPPNQSLSPAMWAAKVAEYLDSGERPSYKVLLAHIVKAANNDGLPEFSRLLIERHHDEWGNYLNYLFIVLQADGTKEIAKLTAKMFAKQNVLVVPIDLSRRNSGGMLPDSPEATGLAAIITYEGRTVVRIEGEPFYVSGNPPPVREVWRPSGGTTSVLFVYRKAKPGKMYRLDFDTLKKGANQGAKGWEHNQDGVAKILGLRVTNHQPAGGWAKAAGWACRVFRWGGRMLFLVG